MRTRGAYWCLQLYVRIVLYDLHRHLEGSHSPAALTEVARTFDIRAPIFYDAPARRFRTPEELAADLTMAGPADDTSIFYRCIVNARMAYVSVAAIGALARLAFREAAAEADGFEMRLSLFSMARTLIEHERRAWRDLTPVDFAEQFARPILLAVIAARDEVQTETGKPILLRLGLSRTFESEPHYRALGVMAVEHASSLVGLDVLGILPTGDPEPLQPGLVAVLDDMRRALPDLTIHAGELSGHASVDRTLALAPRGIGHGVHALESPATLERLAREGVTLEVCPTSNALLIPRALAALQQAHDGHTPLRALQHAGVHCVLGSDDPTPMGTSFPHELEVARTAGVDMARLEADMLRRWAEITT
jgi:Adenosine deaminase